MHPLYALSSPTLPPTESYPLSLHDALPICRATLGHVPRKGCGRDFSPVQRSAPRKARAGPETRESAPHRWRSEEHTSELQSLRHLVCRLLLEKKKKHILNTLTQDRSSRACG